MSRNVSYFELRKVRTMGIQMTDYHTDWPSWTKFKLTRNTSFGYFLRTKKYFHFIDTKIWLCSGMCPLLGEWRSTAGLLLSFLNRAVLPCTQDTAWHWGPQALTCLMTGLLPGKHQLWSPEAHIICIWHPPKTIKNSSLSLKVSAVKLRDFSPFFLCFTMFLNYVNSFYN